MGRAFVTKTSFTAGELDPLLQGRLDLKALEDGADGERIAAYPGTCRSGPARPGPTATRFRVDAGEYAFTDRLQGVVQGTWQARGDDWIRAWDFTAR